MMETAFLHAPIEKDHDGKQRDVYFWPPKELCPQQDKIWRLKKAMYGLRSSPKAWQDYLAEVLQKLSFVRLKSEPNVYTNATRDCYIMVYADDLLVLGDKTTVDPTFEAIQKQVLLKHIGYLEPGKPQQFLGRNIDHFGNYCNLGLKESYIDNMIEESGMNNCNSVNTPGIAHYKPTIEDEAQKDCWQTSMVSIHTARHCILHKRTSTRPHSTYRTFTKESQTSTTLLARHQALQIHHRTNNNTQSKHQQHPGSRRSCRRRLGRMPYYQEAHFRFQHPLPWNYSCIRQQNTGYNSTKRTLRNMHRS